MAGSGAPFLVTLAYQHVRSDAAENAAPGAGARYDFPLAAPAIEKLLRERPPGWFRDYDAMLLQSLADAVDEGRRIQGGDIKHWQYGVYSRIALRDPVVRQIPLLGKYFDLGPLPIAGSSKTVQQVTRTLAPSMRMNIDLADWDRSLLNIQTGQSGQPLSSHLSDQWKAWYGGTSFPMPFQKLDPKSVLEFRPAK